MAPGNNPPVIPAGNDFRHVMLRGNIALSDQRTEEAIRLYTKVLYTLSPGHVCALLNRSMAYLLDGYAELAVMDAHRACIAADELLKNNPVANKRVGRVAKYIKSERLHVDADRRWTRPGQRNIGPGWERSPMASIVVNATPATSRPNGAQIPPFGTSRASLARALAIRAKYRLCGTLFEVGQGARMDALELIDNSKSRMKMNSWEKAWFNKLGNEIIDDLVAQDDPTDPEALRCLGHDTKEQRDERMTKLKESTKAPTSSYGYGDYPFDTKEPRLRERHWQKEAQALTEGRSYNVSAVVMQPEETENTPPEGPKLFVELRANRDISSEDLVLSDKTISRVTTSIPEQIQAKRRSDNLDHYHCNHCASLLLVPRECAEREMMPPPPIPPSSIINNPNHPSSTRGRPPLLARSTSGRVLPSQDFKFCHPSHMVPTCSAKCQMRSVDFEKGLCDTKIEQELRQSHFKELGHRSMTECKTQCLRDLMFLRHITMAMNAGQNPLAHCNLMFATSGPNMRGIEYEKVEPWSYVSHVVRPIRYLEQFFENTNTDQFSELSRLDGWIIYTLLVKITRAMCISKGPRYIKSFRADGMCDTASGPRDKRWEDVTQIPKEDDDDSVWIASIDSFYNMIRIADPALGETPNVTVTQREDLEVFAIKTDSGPAIRAGEPLLRAANPVEGLVLYSLDWQDGMEEMGDEEVHSGDTSDFLEGSSDDDDGVDGEGNYEGEGVGEAMEVGEEAGGAMEGDVDRLFH